MSLAMVVVVGCRTALPGARLSGRVVITGQADRHGIVVTAGGPNSATTTTRLDGSYAFDDVIDGGYAVSATVRSTVEGTRSALVVANGPAVLPDLVFTPAGGVTGRATRGGGNVGNAGILVTVEGTSALGVTDDAGDYHIDLVATGTYDVHAETTGFHAATAPGQVVRWDQITHVPEIDLVIGPGHAALRGVAQLFGKSDHHGTLVTVLGTGLSTTTAADGSWAFENVPEGTYTVTFVNGAYAESVPEVVALAGSDGFVIDESLYALPRSPLTLYRARRIESTPSIHYGFVLSPDGRRLVYANNAATGAKVKMVPLDGSAVIALADGTIDEGYSGLAAAFTPDSARVLFLERDRLHSVSAAGGAPPTTLAAYASMFGLSPDGASAFYSALDPMTGLRALYSVAVSDGATHTVVLDAQLRNPVWSADSKRIIYRTDVDNYFQLGTVKLAAATGGTPVVLGTSAWDAVLSPDRRHALVQSNINTNDVTSTLWVVDLSTGKSTNLGSGVNHYASPGFASNDKVYFSQGLQLYLASVDGGTATNLGLDSYFGNVGLSTDHSHLAFANACTNANGSCSLFVASVADGRSVQVATGVSDFKLSDDGTRIIYSLNRNPQLLGDMWIARTDGTGTAVQLDSATSIYSAHITPDLSHVVYFKDVGSDSLGTLCIVSTAGGPVTTLATHAQAYTWTFSPNGRFVEFTVLPLGATQSYQPGTLNYAPLDGSPATPVVDDFHDGVAWSAGSLLVAARSGSAPPYRFQDGFYVQTP